MQQLRHESYQVISKFLYARAGIHLGENKITLVESRLQKRLRQLGMKSWNDYAAYLENSADSEKQIIIEALTTHKTDWFRDSEHYEILIEVAKSRPQDFMIWSAASSTGEEAYSAALALAAAGRATNSFRILGTDISDEVVETANDGRYRWGHGTESLQRHKRFLETDSEGYFSVEASLRKVVKFRPMNLMAPHLPGPLKFDFVFLRNVLIYFNQDSTRKALDNVTNAMKPGGLLLLGLSETLRFQHPQLKSLGRAVYQYSP